MSDRVAPLVLPFLPGRAAASIRRAPRWLLSLTILLCAQIALEVIAHPVMVEQTVTHLPPTATPIERDVVRDELDAALASDLSMVPLKEIAARAAEALVLGIIFGAITASPRPRFTQMFTLCLGLSGIGVLEKAAEIAFLTLTHQHHGLPAFPWSALAIVRGGQFSYAAGLLLTTINLFTLWYVGALSWALAVLCNISKAQAVLIAFVFRAATAGCAIALLHLLRNAYAFTF